MRYTLLGPVSVTGPDGPVRPAGPKQSAVLAALLLNANRVVPEERLVDLVWGDQPPPSARNRLHVHVSELRKLLGRDVIRRRSSGYRIDVGPGELDLELFDQAVAEARLGGPDAGDRLRFALGLCDGPLLGGVSEPLAQRERPALERQRLAVLTELYDIELADGRHAAVLGDLTKLTGEHPYDERLLGQLMLALHRCGRTSEALALYSAAHVRFATELGVDPGRPLRDLHVRLRRGEDTAAPEARVARPARPAELPLDVPGFAGRGRELVALDERPGGVWVISGVAGVGKTALAVHWAHTVRDLFPDGQLYLDLRGFDRQDEPLTPAVALARLLRTLGVDPREAPGEVDDQARLYRSLLAGKQVLVVLDNARDTAQVLPLLPPNGLTLVTSRQQLGELVVRAGARPLPLGPLAAEESHALLTEALGTGRVAAEPDATLELARLCGHHPLALRVAAANITNGASTTIRSLATELGSGSPLATLTVDGADEGMVSAAFAMSYRALAPEHRRLFRLLGLVPGTDFTPAAAAALADAGVPEAARRLNALTAANLVERHATGRYRFHDLVRHYAAEQARAEEDEAALGAAWHRLLGFYTAAVDAAVGMFGPPVVALPRHEPPVTGHAMTFADVTEALAWLDIEVPNLTAALRCAVGRGPYPMAWYLTDGLRRFFHRHGRRVEWLDIAPALLDSVVQAGERPVESLLNLSIGTACFRAGRREQGIHHLREAVRVSRECGWLECEASAMAGLGTMFERTGRLSDAVTHSRRAVALFRQTGSAVGQSVALNALGCHYGHLGRLGHAEECFTGAIAVSRREGLGYWEAVNLAGLACVRHSTGQVRQAENLLTRAREMFRSAGSRLGEATALNGLSLVHGAADDHRLACHEAGEALDLARQDGDKVTEVTALTMLGNAQTGLGLLEPAAENYRLALAVTAGSGLRWQRAEAATGLAAVRAMTGRADEAFSLIHEALALARDGGYLMVEASVLIALSDVYTSVGRVGRAVMACRAALDIWRLVGHRTGAARALRTLDRITAKVPS